MGYLTPESKQALLAAVEGIERASSAEVVIAVRPSSTSALAPSGIAFALGALAGLAFLLFSPWPFSHVAILLDTALTGALSALVCWRIPALRRLLSPERLVRRDITRSARAEFVELGVCETRERTGLLVYVSQVERRAAVVADRGVTARVDPALLRAGIERIEQVVRRREDGVALAEAVRALEGALAASLPRRTDDLNELQDRVHA